MWAELNLFKLFQISDSTEGLDYIFLCTDFHFQGCHSGIFAFRSALDYRRTYLNDMSMCVFA